MRYKQVNDMLVPLSQGEEDEFAAEWKLWRVALRADLVRKTRVSAGEAIIAALPLWHQSNLHTRFLTLLRNGVASWIEKDHIEARHIEEAWVWIDVVRQASDALEKQLLALPDNQLDTFVWSDWPAPPASV